MTTAPQLLIGTMAVGLLCCRVAVWAGPVYPLQKSANGRYLVDQNHTPFLIAGDAPQSLTVNVSTNDADMYFANRQAHAFNTLWVNLLCNDGTAGRTDGSTYDGILPFTGYLAGHAGDPNYYDLAKPNSNFFARCDWMINQAANYGLVFFLDPAETIGWLRNNGSNGVLINNGTNACRAYGQFLGNRYKNFPNIVWMSGNDFQNWSTPAADAVVTAVALGIKDTDTNHIHTVELDYLTSGSLDDPNWKPIISLNASYTYYPTYAQILKDYNRTNFVPVFLVEANYEFESLQGPVTTAPILRKQEYWANLSGATGQLYGNHYTWTFENGWQNFLDTPGAFQMAHVRTLFEPRAWYNLIPDTNHVVVTGGYGTFSSTGYVADNDYLTAARTADGTLVIAYTPILRTFTVDMTKLSASATARWYDPSSGTYTAIAGSPFANTGTHNFTPPGNNSDGDGGWVLVLETQPPETEPPTVTLTAPTAGATVLNIVAISATATDNVGVIGVQFQVDGVNLGPEVSAAPYTNSWNTLTATNGAHIIQAIARDLAGNRASNGVSVTVNNPLPPVPTDHLALAYAFSESTGPTTADASGNGNTGTLHGGTFTNGHTGNCLAFNGTSNYTEATNSASLDISGTGLTIAFWVKVNSTGSGVDYVIVGKPWNASTMTTPYYQYGVEYSNSGNKTLDFFFGGPAASLHGPYRMAVTPGVWAHVAFTYDGNVVKGYLNGAEQLSTADASSLQARGNSLRLGVDGAYQQFFNGALDDLRIYSRALTLSEVQTVMQTPVVAAPPTITSVATSNNNFVINFRTLAGILYDVQRTSDLTSNAWSAIATNLVGTGGVLQFTDTNALSQPKHFYRVKPLP